MPGRLLVEVVGDSAMEIDDPSASTLSSSIASSSSSLRSCPLFLTLQACLLFWNHIWTALGVMASSRASLRRSCVEGKKVFSNTALSAAS